MENFFRVQSGSENMTQRIAGQIAKEILHVKSRDHAYVILLKGELGTGKTAFTKGFLKQLGIRPRAASPTFVIIKRYVISAKSKIKNTNVREVYHIDAYRLHTKKDLDSLGFAELYQDPSSLIFIEWPEKVRGIRQLADIEISFQYGKDVDTRSIIVKKIPARRV